MSRIGRTSFRDSQLQGADFAFSKINAQTDFTSADLTGAALQQVGGTSNPEVGAFFGAVLVHAKLMGIVFTDVRAADLSGAILYGADLSRIQELESVDLSGVCYDDRTLWPVGFTPPERGNDDTCTVNHLKDFYGARGLPIPDFYFEPMGRLPRP
ncbi:pentapeptide repeat-containing protein [Arthrobacter sp. UYCu712]|uniref:pentapeptide repeat-containing protein n=1 Tax=Arthrobacter sp. UYCu712 TaxID=3156340 RepID=UPI0033981652